MAGVEQIRRSQIFQRLRGVWALIRQRFKPHCTTRAERLETELNFWVNIWDKRFKEGKYWNKDIPLLLDDIDPAHSYSYEKRRWQEARAYVLRILREAQIEDMMFFHNKVLVEIGPGPVGFLEASGARVKVGVEPLALEYKRHDLLLENTDVTYLLARGEELPLIDECADVIVARNSLDHVSDPKKVIEEVWRVLRTGGHFILNVDIGHPPTVLEPHTFTVEDLREMTRCFRSLNETIYEEPHGETGKMFVAVYQKGEDAFAVR